MGLLIEQSCVAGPIEFNNSTFSSIHFLGRHGPYRDTFIELHFANQRLAVGLSVTHLHPVSRNPARRTELAMAGGGS